MVAPDCVFASSDTRIVLVVICTLLLVARSHESLLGHRVGLRHFDQVLVNSRHRAAPKSDGQPKSDGP